MTVPWQRCGNGGSEKLHGLFQATQPGSARLGLEPSYPFRSPALSGHLSALLPDLRLREWAGPPSPSSLLVTGLCEGFLLSFTLRFAQLRLRVALTTHFWFSPWQTHFQLHPYSLTGFKSWLSYLLTPVMYTHRYTRHSARVCWVPVCHSRHPLHSEMVTPGQGGQARVAPTCCSFTRRRPGQCANLSLPDPLQPEKGHWNREPLLERSLPRPPPAPPDIGFPPSPGE